MTRGIRWMTVLVMLCSFLSGAAYGQDEGGYGQMAQQIIKQMEQSGLEGDRVETGISFSSSEAARDFAKYFYEVGYWGNEELKLGIVDYSDRPSYYELLVFSPNPGAAASQHRMVEEEVRKLSETIRTSSEDDLKRAETAYDWIYQNMEYDYSLKSNNLYQALQTGKTICFGYAGLFHAICSNMALECEIVYGDNHAWNRVRLDGEWRYVDITWDKGMGEHKWRFVTEEVWNLTHPCREEGKTSCG